jgi:hypothetical protein
MPVARSPAVVTVFSAERLRAEPAKTIDDRLREASSFGLFRRSSSLVADPSSQGLNLRGVGPSGVSRSLLLVDGVPANDAFGGWIYWRSLPVAIDRVEIAPGGASAQYGSAALGGVVQLVLPSIADSLEAELGAGNLGTVGASVRAARRGKRIAASIEADGLATGGYTFVAPEFRGPVDQRASADHGLITARVEADAAQHLLLSLRGSLFGETQNGGTPHTTASVRQAELVAGARWEEERIGTLDLQLFAHLEEFDQDRATILPDPTTRASAALSAKCGNDRADQLAGRSCLRRRQRRRRRCHRRSMSKRVRAGLPCQHDPGGDRKEVWKDLRADLPARHYRLAEYFQGPGDLHTGCMPEPHDHHHDHPRHHDGEQRLPAVALRLVRRLEQLRGHQRNGGEPSLLRRPGRHLGGPPGRHSFRFRQRIHHHHAAGDHHQQRDHRRLQLQSARDRRVRRTKRVLRAHRRDSAAERRPDSGSQLEHLHQRHRLPRSVTSLESGPPPDQGWLLTGP